MKSKYTITIKEVVSENFEIEADNIHKALEIAENLYKSGELVLCPGNLIDKKISAKDEKGQYIDWYEF